MSNLSKVLFSTNDVTINVEASHQLSALESPQESTVRLLLQPKVFRGSQKAKIIARRIKLNGDLKKAMTLMERYNPSMIQ